MSLLFCLIQRHRLRKSTHHRGQWRVFEIARREAYEVQLSLIFMAHISSPWRDRVMMIDGYDQWC